MTTKRSLPGNGTPALHWPRRGTGVSFPHHVYTVGRSLAVEAGGPQRAGAGSRPTFGALLALHCRQGGYRISATFDGLMGMSGVYELSPSDGNGYTGHGYTGDAAVPRPA